MAKQGACNRAAVAAAWAIIAAGAAALVLSAAAGAPAQAVLSGIGIRAAIPRQLISDSRAAMAITVIDCRSGGPVPGASVTVRLGDSEDKVGRQLFAGKTDAAGVAKAEFHVPAFEPGTYKLAIEARSGRAVETYETSVRLVRAFHIILTTDKPLYQPGQTIHIRALVLKRPQLVPARGAMVRLEVRDAKGNKVFIRKLKTSQFGVAAADFQLADQVNMGRYECRAIVEGAQATKTVEVKRYVLPKFKVTVTADRPFYLPGWKLRGKVEARYFFGKPVAGGRVKVTLKTFDVAYKTFAELQGRTNSEGVWEFEARLPRHFVGTPLLQGQALLQIDCQVTDAAQHTEQAAVQLPVAAKELVIRAVPEGGRLVPGVPNRIWVVVADPSGKPVPAKVALIGAQAEKPVKIRWRHQRTETDELGIAQVEVTPEVPAEARPAAAAPAVGPRIMGPAPRGGEIAGPGAPRWSATLSLVALSREGVRVREDVQVPVGGGTEGLLLRTDKAIYRVGDRIVAVALAGAPTGTIYFDLIKDRQTMLTQAARLSNGRARVTISVGPELAGSVYLRAWKVARSGEIVSDIRPLVVDPANDLSIAVQPDRDTYRPGQPAKVAFVVRDKSGRPVVAAIGLSIVDESVFAIQDMRPGMERVYAYLEEELRKPRFEIHGLELPLIIARPKLQLNPARQRAAQVMLAAAEIPSFELKIADTYAERLEKAKREWARKLEPKLRVIWRAIRNYTKRFGRAPSIEAGLDELVRCGLLSREDILDLWGHKLYAVPSWPGAEDLRAATIWSAGPDGQRDTADDFPLAMHLWERRLIGRGGPMVFPAAPKAAGMGPAAVEMAAEGEGEGGAAPAAKPVRVRQFFPETLLFEPQLITDTSGRAEISFNMADSITTWRLTAMANAADGALGSTSAPLRCFQDFFVDLDLPVALTDGDEIALPVAVYNYLSEPQKVRLKLEAADWFELLGDAEQVLDLKPNEVTVRYFRIRARRIGQHKLTVLAYGSKMSDAIRKPVRVEPDGKMFERTVSGRVKKRATAQVLIPERAISEANVLLVKIYPGFFSQAVEGLDSMLRMPFGCFEQTTSITYPNVLVLDYMTTAGSVTPEIQMKAEGYINFGYQRMLSYEVKGGGFSWFGDPPANRLLTAWGLMAFYDMAQVYPIDESVITRTQQWLLAQQRADGSWEPDKQYLHAESWAKLQNKKLAPTAYITWALASTGAKGERPLRGWQWVREHWQEAENAYLLAVVCNALVAGDAAWHGGKLDDATIEALEKLLSMAKSDGDKMWWQAGMESMTRSSGKTADVETTALAAIALIKSGRYPAEASRALNFLISAKDPHGTWGSTQATILALKALLLAQKGAAAKVQGTVTVLVNGKRAGSVRITPENAEAVQMIDCSELARNGSNAVEVQFDGEGSVLYQVVARWWMPWKYVKKPGRPLLDIEVSYDRSQLAVNDTATATVRIVNNAPGATSMVVVDIGIPPGFSVISGDLQELVDAGTIDRFSLTGRQIIIYLERIDAGQEITFSYRLRARFPIRAKAPRSMAYEYYNPDNRSFSPPKKITVR